MGVNPLIDMNILSANPLTNGVEDPGILDKRVENVLNADKLDIRSVLVKPINLEPVLLPQIRFLEGLHSFVEH